MTSKLPPREAIDDLDHFLDPRFLRSIWFEKPHDVAQNDPALIRGSGACDKALEFGKAGRCPLLDDRRGDVGHAACVLVKLFPANLCLLL